MPHGVLQQPAHLKECEGKGLEALKHFCANSLNDKEKVKTSVGKLKSWCNFATKLLTVAPKTAVFFMVIIQELSELLRGTITLNLNHGSSSFDIFLLDWNQKSKTDCQFTELWAIPSHGQWIYFESRTSIPRESLQILNWCQASVITAKIAEQFPLSGGSHLLSRTLILTWSSLKFCSVPHAILILMHLITEIEIGTKGKARWEFAP